MSTSNSADQTFKWVVTVDIGGGETLYVRPRDLLTKSQAKLYTVQILKDGIWEDNMYYPAARFVGALLDISKEG